MRERSREGADLRGRGEIEFWNDRRTRPLDEVEVVLYLDHYLVDEATVPSAGAGSG